MSPETIGLSREATDVGVVLGKHSGRNALRTRLAAMGYTLEADALNEVRLRCVLTRDAFILCHNSYVSFIVSSRDGVGTEVAQYAPGLCTVVPL